MTIPPVQIRSATLDDLAAINDIYNYFVLNSTCTYQEVPETMNERHAWFTSHGPPHPVTVALLAGEVVGWGSLSPYHERSAYRRAVENSVYVAHTHHGRGIGRLILQDLLDRAKSIGHRTIIAGIDGEQAASIALHSKMGFLEVGLLREVGFKFGRWLDVRYFQLML